MRAPRLLIVSTLHFFEEFWCIADDEFHGATRIFEQSNRRFMTLALNINAIYRNQLIAAFQAAMKIGNAAWYNARNVNRRVLLFA